MQQVLEYPKKTADILQLHHWCDHEMISEATSTRIRQDTFETAHLFTRIGLPCTRNQ